MICLDSTFFIDFLRNDFGAVKKAKEIENLELVTTSINVFEVMLGINLMKKNKEKHLEKFEQVIGRLKVLPFDLDSSKSSAGILADLIKEGKTIEDFDCLIIGAMKCSNCDVIITRNVSHFNRIAGIKVESY